MSLENLFRNMPGLQQLDETAQANLRREMAQMNRQQPPAPSAGRFRAPVQAPMPDSGAQERRADLTRALNDEMRGVNVPDGREVSSPSVDRLGVETLLSGDAPKMGGRRTSEQMSRTREAQRKNLAQSTAPIPREKPDAPSQPNLLDRFFDKLQKDDEFARSMAMFGFSLAAGPGNGFFADLGEAAKVSMSYYDNLKNAKTKAEQNKVDAAYKKALTKKAEAEASGQGMSTVGKTIRDYENALKSAYPNMAEPELRRQALKLATGAKSNPEQTWARGLELAVKIMENDPRMMNELSKLGPGAVQKRMAEIAMGFGFAPPEGMTQDSAPKPVMSISLEDLGIQKPQ